MIASPLECGGVVLKERLEAAVLVLASHVMEVPGVGPVDCVAQDRDHAAV
jgi:hypothetical protein